MAVAGAFSSLICGRRRTAPEVKLLKQPCEVVLLTINSVK